MAATVAAQPVDTTKVAGRRQLQFRNHDEVLADAEHLAAGGYRRLGNWSLGQVAQHLAKAMQSGLDGAPAQMPWVARFLARLFIKNRILRGPMQAGFKLPKKFVGLMPDTSADREGLEALRTAVRRWKNEPQRHPHGFFGQLTNEEWDQLMLRHAELHMSFLLPQ